MIHPWVKRWLTTTNHKEIGILYIVTSLYFLFIGGLLAELVRIQLAVPENNFLQPVYYNQAVTMHGLIMVLWFLSPLGFGFANYFVPLQIGAKDLAFPRLNAFSYWLYLFSGLVAATGFFIPGGAISGGWTVYAPLSSLQYSPGAGTTLGAAGLIMLTASVTMSSVNFIVTILYHRSKEITFSKMPIFTWFILFTVIITLFAFPPLLAALIMLAADRLLGTWFFTSAAGGAILWDHLFWFFGHPEVYIVLLPAFGAVAEIISHYSSKEIYAKNAIILSLAIASFLSLVVWGHHMYITGINLSEREIFTVTTELISVPFGVMVISYIWTLNKGTVRLATPMLFALGSISLFVIGGITGVFNSSVALDIGIRGTYWVVAHFHYVMVGATLFGLFGALYYWYPKITGLEYSDRAGKLHFITSFIGFNLLYFPMFFLYDMPRRISTYSSATGWAPYNYVATTGALLFGIAQLLLVLNLVRPFVSFPRGAYTLWERGAGNIRVMTHASNPTVNENTESEVGHTTPLPLLLSFGTAVFFLGILFGIPAFALGLIILIYGIVRWFKDDFYSRFKGPEPGEERWPFESISKETLGMWVFIASEIMLFGSVISSYIFIRSNFPQWPSPAAIHDIPLGLFNTTVLITSGFTMFLAMINAREGKQVGMLVALTSTMLLGSVFLSVKFSEWYNLISNGFTPSSGLPGSTFYLATGLHAGHVIAGVFLLGYFVFKTLKGGYVKERGSIESFGIYWAFVDAIWLVLFPLFYLV